MRRVWHADRGRLLLRTPGPVPLGRICSTCRDQSFSELVVILLDYALRISLGTFSIWLNEKHEISLMKGIKRSICCIFGLIHTI